MYLNLHRISPAKILRLYSAVLRTFSTNICFRPSISFLSQSQTTAWKSVIVRKVNAQIKAADYELKPFPTLVPTVDIIEYTVIRQKIVQFRQKRFLVIKIAVDDIDVAFKVLDTQKIIPSTFK